MTKTNLDFTARYRVGHGTSIYATFSTAAELNAWYDAQDSEGRYFCRLYDTEKHIDILGSRYMHLSADERWADDPAPEAETITKQAVLDQALEDYKYHLGKWAVAFEQQTDMSREPNDRKYYATLARDEAAMMDAIALLISHLNIMSYDDFCALAHE